MPLTWRGQIYGQTVHHVHHVHHVHQSEAGVDSR